MAIKKHFTKEVIANLPLPETGKRVDYRDTKTAGLQLRVTSSGIKSFSLLRRINGNLERITLGRFPDTTLEQAKHKAVLIAAEIAQGKNPGEAKRAGRQAITFAEAFDDFLQNRRSKRGSYLAENTKRNYQSAYDLHLKKLSKKTLAEISSDAIRSLHTKLGKIAPYSANRMLALVSSIYGHAKEQKIYTGSNPAQDIRKFPEDHRERFAQSDELPRLFAAMAEDPLGDFFLLALLTGARRANVQAMRWEDINFQRGEWRIGVTKNGTPQTVTLSPEAMEVIMQRQQAAPESSPFVFPGVGKTGHIVEPKSAWARILKHAELENLRIHDLRRTLGSWQAKTGASLTIIGKSLNHKTHQATAIYARLDLDPVRQSVNTATTAMMAAGGLKPTAEVVKIKKG